MCPDQGFQQHYLELQLVVQLPQPILHDTGQAEQQRVPDPLVSIDAGTNEDMGLLSSDPSILFQL